MPYLNYCLSPSPSPPEEMETITFQVIDLHDEDEEEEETGGVTARRYTVRLFGRTLCDDPVHPDKSVCIAVEDFYPYFYLQGQWDEPSSVACFQEWLRVTRGVTLKTWSLHHDLNDFDGFHTDRGLPFLKLVFSSSADLRRTANAISVMLRLEVDAWISVEWDDLESMCRCMNIGRNDVELGDIPDDSDTRSIRVRLPNAGAYREACRALNKYFMTSRRSCDPVYDVFEDSMRGELRVRLYEANIDPILRFMHVTGIRGTGWAQLQLRAGSGGGSSTFCDIEAIVPIDHIRPVPAPGSGVARFRICSYDAEMTSCDGNFPRAARPEDKIIQVGMTFNHYGEDTCYRRIILSLLPCAPIAGAEVISFDGDEAAMLLEFTAVLQREDPDIIAGYNTFGFDNPYMKTRAEMFGIDAAFSEWSRIVERRCKFRKKRLSSSALGDNILQCYDIPGRVQIDFMKVVQRDHSLPSYALDAVSSHFNQNDIENIVGPGLVRTKGWHGLEVGAYFKIKTVELCVIEDVLPHKYKVTDLPDEHHIRFEGGGGASIPVPTSDVRVRWTMAKDDLPPSDIFSLWSKDDASRAVIGKYCLKDCVLVNFLMEKLDVLSNNFAMANVCWVPLRYIFMRGQSIKGLSLVAEQCRRQGYVIPVVRRDDFSNIIYRQGAGTPASVRGAPAECTYSGCGKRVKMLVYEGADVCPQCNRIQYHAGYQGAMVLEPRPGLYRTPVAVLDYASLYPRSIISRNISWETLVQDPDQAAVPGYDYHEVTYIDNDGTPVRCLFAQPESGEYGIIPKILLELLAERSATKKKMKQEKDPFRMKVLDGHQLALKLTCNSLYGQVGASTSPLYKKALAACTTAEGQMMLQRAKTFIEDELPALVMRDTGIQIRPVVHYGDSDSIFCSFGLPSEEALTDRERVQMTIDMGKRAASLLNPLLRKPQEIEYEKVYYPWVIFSKKRYAGFKYEDAADTRVVSTMGLALRRRDYSRIVKKVCGGVLHRMLMGDAADDILRFTREMIETIVGGGYDQEYFVTSKRLRQDYANPGNLAHVALAKRMAERDPGSAPKPSDRIQYLYIYREEMLDKKNVLQADMVEEAEYVRLHRLPIDYLHYVTNQIRSPVLQFLLLIAEDAEDRVFNPIIERVLKERRIKRSRAILDRRFNRLFETDGDRDGFNVKLA